MERYRERSIFVPVVIGYLIGNLLGRLASPDGVDVAEQMRLAQISNAQIEEQLAEDYPGMEDLLVTETNFGFDYEQKGEQNRCDGRYEVIDDVATVTGDIVCSVTIATETTTTELGQ